MLLSSLTLDPKRPHDIPKTVKHENPRRHGAFLAITRDVRHAHTYNQTRDRREKADQRVSRQRRAGAFRPRGLPDHDTARHHGQGAADDHDQPDILDFDAEEADREDADEADGAERHLPQQRLVGGIAEGAHDERAESADGAVDRVREPHHQADHPDFVVGEGLDDLAALDLLAAHAHLAVAQAFDCDAFLFFAGEKPG